MDNTEQWEYRIEILRADSEPQFAFLQQRWPQGFKHGKPGFSILLFLDLFPLLLPMLWSHN